MAEIKNVAYLMKYSGESGITKIEGNFEMYRILPDTVILFSPGFMGRGSMRGRWILGDSLVAYSPSERKYYNGSWHRLLLDREERTEGLDSLIFDILSLRAVVTEGEGMRHISGERGNWLIVDSLGRWERGRIFNRRGKLSEVRWRSRETGVEITTKVDKQSPGGLVPDKIKLVYLNSETEVEFQANMATFNVAVPSTKVNFMIPADAVPYEEH